jgi:hypothetical protein
MSIFLSKDFLDSVEEMAFEILKDLEDSAVEAMVDAKGLAYGDVPLTREDRIMKYLMDEQGGVLQVLQLQNPDEFRKRVAQFERDVQDAGLNDG